MMLLLVSEDATKTRRAGVAKLTKEALAGGGRQEELRAALEHLERHRIVRRLPGEGEDAFLLHHDYLARGVREAFRQANRWSEYLREKAVELNTAFGWRQRWRALVPLTMQVRLVLERLRRRFEYGEHRRLAILSTLRMIPLLLVIALLGAVAWWVDRVREELVVAEVVAGIGHGDSMSSVEDAALNRLGF